MQTKSQLNKKEMPKLVKPDFPYNVRYASIAMTAQEKDNFVWAKPTYSLIKNELSCDCGDDYPCRHVKMMLTLMAEAIRLHRDILKDVEIYRPKNFVIDILDE